MRNKKLLAIFIAAVMCLGVLAGCNSGTPVDNPGVQDNPEVEDNSGETETLSDPEDSGEPEPEPAPEVASFRELTANELMVEMGAGWNLGNTMDSVPSIRGMPAQQETGWGNPTTTPEMIQLLKDTGFGTLRIPVTWHVFIGPEPDYSVADAMLDRVQEIVDYGIERDMYVIINMHHENWLYPSEENFEPAKAKLTTAWAQIAERFGGYSEKLIFEAMNEPRMIGNELEWRGGDETARDVINKWNAAFVEAIRATGGNNAKRWLMVPTIAASGDYPALRGFVMPDDDNVIVSIHAYVPNNLALRQRNSQKTFDPENTSNTYDIDDLFKRLNEYFLSKGYPVVMGEMGIVNKENLDDRVRWTTYYGELAAANNVPCIWWDNGILYNTNNESFGIMDRREVEWWFPEIAEALVAAMATMDN
ncbi:MAG: glycoside hydrolase family 5 protein [Oscillospiraceae bacterium]|nr:glycoside hydrolase family 5 protein [Oscillospiraceae bacterium]